MHLEKVKIKRIIGPTPSGAAVLLGNEKKTFVVFIGFYEAAAILRELNHEVPARPLTHELIQNIFLGFDVEVKRVVISAILENTFCATLVLQQRVQSGKEEWAGKRNEVRIDARPSDCFVIALKNKVDIYVTPEVFEQVQDVSKMTEEVEGSLAGGQLGSGTSGEEFELDFSESKESPGEPGASSGEDDVLEPSDPDVEESDDFDLPEDEPEEDSEEETP